MYSQLDKFKKKITKNKLFKDSFWALFGSVLGKGLSLLAGILVARFLGKEIYGQYGVVKSTLITIGMFSTFGLGYTATKYISENLENSKEKIQPLCRLLLTITFCCSTPISVLAFIFSKQIATFLEAPGLDTGIRMCSIIIIFNALTLTQIGIMSGLGKYKTIAKNNTYSGVLTFVLSFFLTYKFLFSGALWALLISQCFNFIINFLSIKKTLSTTYPTNGIINKKTNLTKEIMGFSLPVALQESLVFIFSWISTYLLIVLTNYGEVGILSAATQWNAIILFIPGVLRNVTLSHLSGIGNNTSGRKKILYSMLFINFSTTTLAYLTICIFSSIINSFYGPSFNGIATIISISTISTIFNSMSDVYVQEYMSRNKNWLILSLRMLKDGSAIAMAAFFIIGLNLTGAKATAISSVLFSVLYFAELALLHQYISRRTAHSFSTCQ